VIARTDDFLNYLYVAAMSAMLANRHRSFFLLTLVLAAGCNLPTAPENGHSALVSDASVTTGRGRASQPLGHRLSPTCSAPARLHSAFPQERVPGYIVSYRAGTDAKVVTAELAATYGFTPIFVFNGAPGFAAVLSEQALAGIRCDSRVSFVEYDVSVYLAK
jgi:hypothetical protein